jgi:hypothetical protein
MGGESFDLRLVALADDDAPPAIRLKRILKALLRAGRFRCVSAVGDDDPRTKSPPERTPGRLAGTRMKRGET